MSYPHGDLAGIRYHRRMSRCAVAVALLAAACGSKSAGTPEQKAVPVGEKVTVPGEPPTMGKAVEPGGGSATPASADDPLKLKPDEGTLAIDSPADAKAGAEAVAHLVLTPGTGFHVNTEFPIKLTLESPAGVTLAKAEFVAGGHDKSKGDADALDEQKLDFAIKLTAAEAGNYTINGKLKFAVCDDHDLPSEEGADRDHRRGQVTGRHRGEVIRSGRWRSPIALVRDLLVELGTVGARRLHAQPPRDVVRRVPRRSSFAEPTRQLRSRRRSTSSTASTTTARATVKYPWGEVRRFEPVRRAVGQRRGSPVRPGERPEPDLPGAAQLRAGRPAEQADPAARPERLREVDVHPLPRSRARALLDARRGRAVPVLVDLPGAEAARAVASASAAPRARRRPWRSTRSRTCPTT